MISWQEQIKRDLIPFANAGSRLESKEEGAWLNISWRSRQTSNNASFALNEDGTTKVKFEGAELSYRAFLASPQISDMLGIAGMIIESQEEDVFVDTRAVSPSRRGEVESAVDLIYRQIENAKQETTTVVFVTADAGAGKTEVLKRLVARQAERYRRGEADFLFLYVNAQGRALARLEEALATEIQDLRASNLTYHAVPTLARNRILIPLIDGFDELLGVLGYEDSFNSLRRFLSDLNGQGCIIASARSTYYQQEFVSRAFKNTSDAADITVEEVEVLPWHDAEFNEYLIKRHEQDKSTTIPFEQFRIQMNAAFDAGENIALRDKPFFVAAASSLILEGVEISGENLIEQLIDGYVERERTAKLLNKSGQPLLTNNQIRSFIQAVSEEMWTSETRSLDSDTMKIFADLVFAGEEIDVDTRKILEERAVTMAFFTSGARHNRIEFEHQLFFSYFLGNTIADGLKEGLNSLYSILMRAILPERSASFAAKRSFEAFNDPQKMISECGEVTKRGSLRPPQLRENAGAIVAAYLRQTKLNKSSTPLTNLTFKDLAFAGEVFEEIEIYSSTFENVHFNRCDFTDVKFVRCAAKSVSLQDIVVDPAHTKLQIEGIDILGDVFGLRVRQENGTVNLYRQDSIREILIACEFPAEQELLLSAAEPIFVDLLERLMRKFERSNVFWPNDDENKQIVSNQRWGDLEQKLVTHGVLKREIATGQRGQPKPFYRRMFSSNQIMAGQFNAAGSPKAIREFWASLEDAA